MSKHPIGTSANGKQVHANLTQKPLSTAVARNPHLLNLAGKAVSELSLTEQTISVECDAGRTIGYSEHLETQEKDTIFYAQTSKLPVYTRFVKQRKSEPTSTLTLQLEAIEDGTYKLTDIWIGNHYPPLPSEANASTHSKEYWDTHAVVYNGQSILTNSITKVCPY